MLFAGLLLLLVRESHGWGVRQSNREREDNSRCGYTTSSSRIVGGFAAPYGYVPWQVSVRWQSEHFCGGSILTDRLVVTAAHCFGHSTNSPADISVAAGFLNLSTQTSEANFQFSNVIKVIVYPKFDVSLVDNDLALLVLDTSLTRNDYVHEICLPTSSSQIFDNQMCTVSGWGLLNESTWLSDSLQAVQVPVIPKNKCNQLYPPGYIYASNICAGYTQGGKDACGGDSGGPLACPDSNNYFTLAGIVSWGIGCAQPNQPGVYTRVAEFANWLRGYMQQYS